MSRATLCFALLFASVAWSWQLKGNALLDGDATFYVLLAGVDEQGMQRELAAVSSPSSPQYGKFLTPENIAERFCAAARPHAKRVVTWATSHGAEATVLRTGDRVRVRTTVSVAQRMLGTDLHAWAHPSAPGIVALRASAPVSVPNAIASSARHVWGLNRLPPVARVRTHGGSSAVASALEGENDVTASPSIVYSTGGDQQFSLSLRPGCPGGAEPRMSASGQPCPGYSLSAVSVTLGTEANGDVTFTPASVTCANATITTNATTRATVTVPRCTVLSPVLAAVDNYQAVTPKSASLTFAPTAGGAATAVSFNATAYAAANPAYGMEAASPDRLKRYYRIPENARGNRTTRNRVAISSYLGEFFSPSDLARYQREAGLTPEPAAAVIGSAPNDPSNPGGEASLDVQTVTGIAPGVPLTVFSFAGGSALAEPYMDWLHKLDDMGNDEIPFVVSTSYGDSEADWTQKDVAAVDAEFVKQGLRGISLLFSAGDDGVASFRVRNADPTAACRIFQPEFPASSPHVTAVGGTQWTRRRAPMCSSTTSSGFTVRCPDVGERVCSSDRGGVITSGGGFSTHFPRGDATFYQNDVVTHYLDTASDLPAPSQWTSTGRAYPDITAVAARFPTYINGSLSFLYGTSASTPLVAGMIALINDARLQSGQPPLGFLNPLLYAAFNATPEVFRDVVQGDVKCTVGSASSRVCCPRGFTAVPGWDPASGLGSFDFLALRAVALDPHVLFPASGGPGWGPHSHHGQHGHSDGNDDTALWVVSILLVVLVLALSVWVALLQRKLGISCCSVANSQSYREMQGDINSQA